MIEAQRQAMQAKREEERMRTETRLAVDRSLESRQSMAENFASFLVVHHHGRIVQYLFCHWRWMTQGVVLPHLRKLALEACSRDETQLAGTSARRQKPRLRRKSFMWWVGQIREMVIRRMVAESWVSSRSCQSLQIAWSTWTHQRHMQNFVNRVDVLMRIQSRRDHQVCS